VVIPLNLPSDFALSVLKATAGIVLLALPFGLAYAGLLIYGWTMRPADRSRLWALNPHPVFLSGFLLLLLGITIAWPAVRGRIDPCDSEAAGTPRSVPRHLEIFRAPILRPGQPIRPYPKPGEPTAIYLCMSYGLPD
jgi:hypothetical protein